MHPRPALDPRPTFVPTTGHATRSVAVSFRLAGSGPVRFVVTKVGAACRPVGSFTVRGRAGANRVPLRARVGRHLLPRGTYRILATRGDEWLFAVRIVVARGRIVESEVVPVTSAACTGATRSAGELLTRSGVPFAAFAPLGRAPTSAKAGPAATPQDASPQHEALGAQFARSAAGGGIDLPRALLLAAMGLALLLLAAATLPDQFVPLTALGIVLLRRRAELALAGTSTLVVAAVAYLVYGR